VVADRRREPGAEADLNAGGDLGARGLIRARGAQVLIEQILKLRSRLLETRRVDGGIEMLLTDSGVGMSEDQISRAFEPFFTTKAEGEGTGLGLSTVFNAVQQNGGDIEIDSQLGEGTSVRVRFPTPSD